MNNNHINKILVFSLAYLPVVGGAELAVKEITDRVRSYTYDMITMRFDDSWPAIEQIGNVTVYRIRSSKLLFPFWAFFKACRLHSQNNYTFIWSIMANRAGFAAMFFKLFHPRLPFLLTLQEGDDLDYPRQRAGILWPCVAWLFKRIFTKADYIQAISHYLKQWAKRMGATAPITVIPNGVTLASFKNKNSYDKKVNTGHQKTIVTTSRLVDKNGIDILIRAIEKLNDNLSGTVHCMIVGTGPQEEEFKELVARLGLDKNVTFVGGVEPETIPYYLQHADIFVRPSRSEGLGNSFLEAMAAGIPVIGTKIGGISDFLFTPKDVGFEHATGLAVETDNSQQLSEAMTYLLENEDIAATLAENGKQLVEKEYSWDKVSQNMRKVFLKMNG